MAHTEHTKFMLEILGQALDKYVEMTAQDVSRELLVGINAARRYMRMLEGARVYSGANRAFTLTRGPAPAPKPKRKPKPRPKRKPKPKPKSKPKLTMKQRLHDELLKRGSMSAGEVSEALGVSYNWARRLMADFPGTERYYVNGWVHFCWRGEAPEKPVRPGRYVNARKQRDENKARLKEAVELAGVMSAAEISDLLGVCRNTVSRYLVDMHKTGEIVRLRWAGLWAFPAGTENPRPPNYARGVIGRVLDIMQDHPASGSRCVELLPEYPPQTVRGAVQSLRGRGEIVPLGGCVYVAA